MILFVFIFFLSCAVRCENNYYVIQMPEDPPNTREPLNDPPLEVYWNVPTMQCTSKKILFEDLYKKFGIIQNEGDSFRGDRIAILYDPGIFPAIFKNETSGKLRFRNGGVPQEGDLEKHLEEFRDIMNQSVTNKDFNGIGIIDFESWRPVYRQNFGVLTPYKDVSYDIERSNHWWWPTGMVTAEAKRRFEESARKFMESTLIAAKQLRPLAKWGYYGFPYCFNSKTERCADKVSLENDHTSWLWTESTALYPSVYSSKDLSPNQLSQYVKGRVEEAARASRGRGKGDVPILPYFWFRYRDGGYMREEDLYTVLKTFANSDASGFIIWGSSNDVNTVDKCIKLLNYVDTILGPAVAKYTNHKRNIDGVGEDIFNSTGTDYIVASEIYDIVTENYSRSNKTGFNSVVNVVKHNNKSETETKVQFNGIFNDNKTFVDFSNDTTKLNGNMTNNSETIKLFNTNLSDLNNKSNNKSGFSVYSAADSILIDKIAKNMYTTEITETITTNKSYEMDINESHKETTENYTKDFIEYVKNDFTEKHDLTDEELRPYIKDNKEANISLDEIIPNTKAKHVSPYDFIFQKLQEYKTKAESILPFQEVVQSQIQKPDVNIYTVPDVSSLGTKNNNSDNSSTEKSEGSKDKNHDCKKCLDKMKEKKKGCSMMMMNRGGHNHRKQTKDGDNKISSEGKPYEHEHSHSNHHHNKEPDKIESNSNKNMDLHFKSTFHDKDITEISSILDSDYTTKQTTVMSDYIQSERDDSKIIKDEIQVINEMMFPFENSVNTTNNHYLDVNITAFEIENVKNGTDDLNFDANLNSSTEIRENLKEITITTEESINLLYNILFETKEMTDNNMTEQNITQVTDASSTSTEITTIESTITESFVTETTEFKSSETETTEIQLPRKENKTKTENTEIKSNKTEITVKESTRTKNSATEGVALVSNNSTTSIEEGFTENISTLRNLITTDEEITNTETTTKFDKEDQVYFMKPKSMTKNKKNGRARNINNLTAKQHENTIADKEIRPKENNLKNMKKGLPKLKDKYENVFQNKAERNEEMNTNKQLPKAQDEYENLKDELPILEDLDIISEKVTGSSTIAASTTAIHYLCFLVLFLVRA